MLRPLAFFLFLMCPLQFIIAQNLPIDKNYFQSPVAFPIVLSGTFGELRGNHFHSGIDIKTQGVEGKQILAAADGFVSRIKISPFGYGKAIYLTHPNGYTTVYAHLSKLAPEIEAFTKKRQYNQQRFEVDLFPPAGALSFKKGDLIAYSGNSGGSGGPHLHFEIRETASEKTVNPLLFGIGPSDGIAPLVNGIRIYPLDENASIAGQKIPLQPNLTIERTGIYKVAQPIKAQGKIGFAVNTFDRLDGASNQNGVYQLTFSANDDTLYQFQAEKFAFAETRYINAHIDFGHFMQAKSRFQKTYVDPGNHLSMYPIKKQRGILDVQANQTYDIVIAVADQAGNVSKITCTIIGEQKPMEALASDAPSQQMVRYNHPFAFQTDLIKVQIPAGTLYQDLPFAYTKTEPNADLMSPWHKILDETIPAHTHYEIGIYGDYSVQQMGEKACIVSRSSNGGMVYEGGTWKGNYLYTSTRSFGSYAIAVDTTAPTITPVNIRQGAVLAHAREIRVRITDNLSGIQSYEPRINGNWVLMDYDAKNNLLTYEFDHMCPKGSHVFDIVVRDKRGNQSTYRANFTR